MGRFKKTDQIFAHLNITLLNSNVLRFRDRTFRLKKRDRLPRLLSHKKRADEPPFVHIL